MSKNLTAILLAILTLAFSFNADASEQRMSTKDEWKLLPEYARKIKELRAELKKLSSDFGDPLDYADPVSSGEKDSPPAKKRSEKSVH